MKEKKMTSNERIFLFLECLKRAEDETHCQLVVIDDDVMIYDYEENQFYELETEEIEGKK